MLKTHLKLLQVREAGNMIKKTHKRYDCSSGRNREGRAEISLCKGAEGRGVRRCEDAIQKTKRKEEKTETVEARVN